MPSAETHRQAPTHSAAPVRRFNAASVNDMFTLGRDSAPLLLQMMRTSKNLHQRTRIGLIGKPNTGKTAWVRGLLSAMDGYELMEDYSLFRLQSIWKDAVNGHGWIRHYDASVKTGPEGHVMPSYVNNDLSAFDLPLVDVTEHADKDIHDKEFDALVYIDKTRSHKDAIRHLAYFVPPPHCEDDDVRNMTRHLTTSYGPA